MTVEPPLHVVASCGCCTGMSRDDWWVSTCMCDVVALYVNESLSWKKHFLRP
ncbi:hypothetical protein TSUD_195790 [Trifolium subterraneum]|nr:hypothetical protein TSUD_195790 [Trifolium subterraneum]